MSNYNTLVSQTEIPYFVELYEFTINTNKIYLTNHKEPLIVPQYATFLPAIIERRDIDINNQGEISTDISIYAGSDAIRMLVTAEVPNIQVKIMLYFLENNIRRTIFNGICKELHVSNEYFISLRLIDFLSLSKVNIPKFIYSAYCNNSLGDSFCKVSLSNYSTLVQVTEVDNRKALVATAFSSYPDDYFTFGYVEYLYQGNFYYRLIIKHSSSEAKVYLHMPMEISVNNEIVRVVAGCDKSPQTCKNKFNNIANFTGFPYIPIKNPTLWGII